MNLTTSSSVPGEISGLSTSIKPDSKTVVLKGSDPSQVYLKFIPSIFKSESNNWPEQETGFHVYSYQNNEVGSVASQEK